MPQNVDPTQTAQAPGDGTTPNNQADPTGQNSDPLEGEGTKYTDDQITRWKQQAEGGKQESEKLKAELETVKASNEMLSRQPVVQAPLAPQAPAGPTFNPDTFLTPEEEALEEKAFEHRDFAQSNKSYCETLRNLQLP